MNHAIVVEKAVDYIEAHIDEDLPLDKIANAMKLPAASCGVSARDSLRSSLVCCAASCGELNPLWD